MEIDVSVYLLDCKVRLTTLFICLSLFVIHILFAKRVIFMNEPIPLFNKSKLAGPTLYKDSNPTESG